MNHPIKPTGHLNFCCMCSADVGAVTAIEQQAYEHPWGRDDFESRLDMPDLWSCYTLYPTRRGPLLGYCIIRHDPECFFIENVTVHPADHRRGLGRSMLDRIQDKLSPFDRQAVEVVVPETMLEAQLFYAACGFRAREVMFGYYGAGSVDGYRMQYLRGEPRVPPIVPPKTPPPVTVARVKNRLGGLL